MSPALRREVEPFQHFIFSAIAQWADLRERLAKSFEALTRADLDGARQHPRRGVLAGRDVLIIVARHAAEHWGEAQLTRSLLKARTGGRQS